MCRCREASQRRKSCLGRNLQARACSRKPSVGPQHRGPRGPGLCVFMVDLKVERVQLFLEGRVPGDSPSTTHSGSPISKVNRGDPDLLMGERGSLASKQGRVHICPFRHKNLKLGLCLEAITFLFRVTVVTVSSAPVFVSPLPLHGPPLRPPLALHWPHRVLLPEPQRRVLQRGGLPEESVGPVLKPTLGSVRAVTSDTEGQKKKIHLFNWPKNPVFVCCRPGGGGFMPPISRPGHS